MDKGDRSEGGALALGVLRRKRKAGVCRTRKVCRCTDQQCLVEVRITANLKKVGGIDDYAVTYVSKFRRRARASPKSYSPHTDTT
jgi:hypothetical protein